jgi:hypothetical protein
MKTGQKTRRKNRQSHEKTKLKHSQEKVNARLGLVFRQDLEQD